MRREVRATANRLANFDDANLRRSARAAVAASSRVERALEILGDTVPEHLQAAGQLRLAHKQASLEEQGGEGDGDRDAEDGPAQRVVPRHGPERDPGQHEDQPRQHGHQDADDAGDHQHPGEQRLDGHGRSIPRPRPRR